MVWGENKGKWKGRSCGNRTQNRLLPFFTFIYFRLITSKFSSSWEIMHMIHTSLLHIHFVKYSFKVIMKMVEQPQVSISLIILFSVQVWPPWAWYPSSCWIGKTLPQSTKDQVSLCIMLTNVQMAPLPGNWWMLAYYLYFFVIVHSFTQSFWSHIHNIGLRTY